MKRLSLFIYLTISSLISAQDFYSYVDIGNMGVEFNTSDLKRVDYFYLTLPTYLLREEVTGLGLSVQSAELRVPFYSSDRFYFTLLESSVFWSPFTRGEASILGPFIDINLVPNKNHWFSARTGVRFLWVNSSVGLFKGTDLERDMIVRNIDLELGYSFLDENFYIALSTDFHILIEGMDYINGDVIKEAFTF